MKRILLSIALLTVFSLPCFSSDVTFLWDYGTPMPGGFEMRISTVAGGSPVITFDCGAASAKTCTVAAVPPGVKFAKVYAYQIGVPATLKEYSAGSNEVTFTVPATPAAPTNTRFPGGTAELRFSVPDDKVAVVKLTFNEKDGEK